MIRGDSFSSRKLRYSVLVGIFLCLMLLGLACAAPAGKDEAQLRKTSKTWEAAFNAGDDRALAAIYAAEGMLLPPNSEFVQGREAIAQFWAELITNIDGELAIQEVSVQGDLAYILGTFKLFATGGEVVDQGKYIEIWKRSNGQWQLYRDIWNTSLPLPETGIQ
ncbi:MAG: YybH family protein [bacterium]